MTRQGGLPGYPSQPGSNFSMYTLRGGVTQQAGVGFVIHQIAQKFTFGGGFASLKVEIENHSNELQHERQVRVEEQNTLASHFFCVRA